MNWGDLFGDVLNAGVSYFGAKQQSDATKKAAQAATPVPYSSYGPWGNVMFDPRANTAQFSMANNPFYSMYNMLGPASLANAATAPGSFLYGADPEIAAAYKGLGTEALQADASQRYNLLSQLAQPEQQRSYNNLQDTLFAQGRLGTSGGGIQQEAWQNAANQADLQRQLAAQDWAGQRAQNRFASALQSVGSGQAGQLQQFNIGSGALGGISNIWQNLLNSGTLGMQAGGMNAMPVGAAAMQAQAAGAPYQAIYGALQQGGAFDWLGKQIGGWMGGSQPQQQQVAGIGNPIMPSTHEVNIPYSPLSFDTPKYDF